MREPEVLEFDSYTTLCELLNTPEAQSLFKTFKSFRKIELQATASNADGLKLRVLFWPDNASLQGKPAIVRKVAEERGVPFRQFGTDVPPAKGKSAIVRDVAEEHGIQFRDLGKSFSPDDVISRLIDLGWKDEGKDTGGECHSLSFGNVEVRIISCSCLFYDGAHFLGQFDSTERSVSAAKSFVRPLL